MGTGLQPVALIAAPARPAAPGVLMHLLLLGFRCHCICTLYKAYKWRCQYWYCVLYHGAARILQRTSCRYAFFSDTSDTGRCGFVKQSTAMTQTSALDNSANLQHLAFRDAVNTWCIVTCHKNKFNLQCARNTAVSQFHTRVKAPCH